MIVNLSASPYRVGYGHSRERMLVQRAVDNLAAVVFVNTVGGQDELVFDGHSLAVDQDGARPGPLPRSSRRASRSARSTRARSPPRACATRATAPTCAASGAPRRSPSRRSCTWPSLEVARRRRDRRRRASRRSARARGRGLRGAAHRPARLRATRTASSTWCSALSGGIDSALVALIAADALGPERVTCVSMPSPYSSEGTRADARAIAGQPRDRLPRDLDRRRDGGLRRAARRGRSPGTEPDIAEENIQARIRGNVVMALSNKFGWLVLTTGNKSELSVGYATLYGDMAGGFAVLKDVYKGWVYRLVRWRNAQAGRELVPASVLERPPSAELRHDQRDEDSLPPYDVLDAILAATSRRTSTPAELVRRGLPADDVERVIAMVDRAEYKRRQAPPGIKISTQAFGRDRRLPITNRYAGTCRGSQRRLRALR